MTNPIGSFQGLASGIQWRDLVEQIIEVETTRALGPIARGLKTENDRIAAWTALAGPMTKVRDAVKALKDGTAFQQRSATVGTTASGRTLASIAGIGAAAAGTYRVEVQNLAQSERLTGLAVADASAALGLSGRFSVNGVSVTLTATDSLSAVRDRINAANTGATASRVSATITSHGGVSRLVLTADATGAAGIELADDRSGAGATSTLEALGFVDATRTMNTGTDGKVRSMRISSTTLAAATALGISVSPSPATILVNGRSITVDLENDSITDIVARINALSPNAATVESEKVGSTNWSRIAINGSVAGDGSPAADLLLETLGMRVGGRGSNVAQAVATGATLTGFGGSTATGATLLADLGVGSAAGVQAGDVIALTGTDGAGAAVTMTYTVTGTDTVDDLLGSIESAFAGGRDVDAAIVDGRIVLTDSVTGDSRLAFTLSAGLQGGGTIDFGANATTYGRVRQLAAGEDARIVVDGATMSSSTNAVTGAVGGGTLTITGEEIGAAFDVTVTATPDAAVGVVQTLASAYNELLSAVAAETKSGGRLPFASSARALIGSLKGILLNTVGGLGDDATYNRAGSVGLTLQKDGTLKLDADAFRAAIVSDVAGVEALFKSAGTAASGFVQYVGADATTPSGEYALIVTQVATRSSVLGSVMSPYVAGGTPATMTVTDEGTGRSATIDFTNGDTVGIIAARLAAAFSEQGVGVGVTVEGGALRLTSAEYGTAAGFTVAYDDPGSEDPAAQLGIAAGAHDNGLDAAGTLDGIVMTGAGQRLTALNGLVLRYTDTVPLAATVVRYTQGLGGALQLSADTALSSSGGPIMLQQDSARTRIASLERREGDIVDRLERKRASLIEQFTRMEAALGRLQGQGQWLSQQISSMNAIAAGRFGR